MPVADWSNLASAQCLQTRFCQLTVHCCSQSWLRPPDCRCTDLTPPSGYSRRWRVSSLPEYSGKRARGKLSELNCGRTETENWYENCERTDCGELIELSDRTVRAWDVTAATVCAILTILHHLCLLHLASSSVIHHLSIRQYISPVNGFFSYNKCPDRLNQRRKTVRSATQCLCLMQNIVGKIDHNSLRGPRIN